MSATQNSPGLIVIVQAFVLSRITIQEGCVVAHELVDPELSSAGRIGTSQCPGPTIAAASFGRLSLTWEQLDVVRDFEGLGFHHSAFCFEIAIRSSSRFVTLIIPCRNPERMSSAPKSPPRLSPPQTPRRTPRRSARSRASCTNSQASRAPCSRSMPLSSHSTDSGPS